MTKRQYDKDGGNIVITPTNLTVYDYKYNGKEWQDELSLNMYDMDMRQYDPAIARWVVQDPVIHHDFSPYNAFDNNPVFWADPSGADAVYDWDSHDAGREGVYKDGDNEISFQQAMASNGLNSDGSEIAGESSPLHDITVNSKGIVTSVVINNKPNRFFDENGQQLFFNDTQNDFSEIDSWRKGDRLFYPISDSELNKQTLKAGVSPLQTRYLGNNILGSYFLTGFMSFGTADFTHSYLAVVYNERGVNPILDDGGVFRKGYNSYTHFFRFGNSNTIFNLYDAGNFMWGNWMKRNGYSYGEAKFGSQMNELFNDSAADQRAIKKGYFHK